MIVTLATQAKIPEKNTVVTTAQVTVVFSGIFACNNTKIPSTRE
jgi:hypothetical protein